MTKKKSGPAIFAPKYKINAPRALRVELVTVNGNKSYSKQFKIDQIRPPFR